jgi:hypothetical protein
VLVVKAGARDVNQSNAHRRRERDATREERRLWRGLIRRDPRLTAADRQILAAAEKLGDGCVVLDAETLSLLAHPDAVLDELGDGAR